MNISCLKKYKGELFALLTAVISGISIYINKVSVGVISPPLVFTTVKNLMVALMILFFVISSRKIVEIKKLNKNEVIKLLLIGIVGGSLPFYLFFSGLAIIPAVNAAIIHKTLFIWVALMALPMLGERVNVWQIFAILSIFASNLFFGGFQGLSFSVGEMLVLSATILWALENIIAKKVLSSVSPEIVTLSRMGIGSVLLLIFSLILYGNKFIEVFTLGLKGWSLLGITALTLFMYTFTWYKALKYAPLTNCTVILALSTIITNLIDGVSSKNASTAFPSLILVQSGIIVLGLIMFFTSKNREVAQNQIA